MYERLWDRDFAKAVDLASTKGTSLTALDLMENAGQAILKHILPLVKTSSRPVLILAGKGNNGGDGLVVARLLLDKKVTLEVCLVDHEKNQLSPGCLSQWQTLLKKHPNMEWYHYKKGVLGKRKLVAPIILDGVLGLGFKGSLGKGLVFSALKEASQLKDKTVVAIDLPSGLDPNSGEKQNLPLTADFTVTFGGLKPAHVISPARSSCGKIFCDDIGFTADAVEKAEKLVPAFLVRANEPQFLAQNPWKLLSQEAHKYDRGHVLVIGASQGKTGAPLLSALAALKCGAGWATVALATKPMQGQLNQIPLELTFEEFFAKGKIHAKPLEIFLRERNVKSVLIGPGCMSQPLDIKALKVLAAMQKEKNLFLAFDAGGLHQLLRLIKQAKIKFNPIRTLLTPHPGEARKLGLAKLSASPLNPEGVSIWQKAADDLGLTLVFKNATPVVITPDQAAAVVDTGTNILAKAGSGDVLAGMACAHGAMRASASVAFIRSQILMAKAAKLAAAKVGEHAVIATDILANIGLVP